MQVDAIMSGGERAQLQVQMTPHWTMLANHDGAQVELALQAIVPSISAGLIYLYGASDARFGAVDALSMPAAAAELLLFAPLVPLLKCQEGFQVMAWSAWKDVASSVCFQDFGMPSSMVSSALGLEEEDQDSASLDSASNGAASEDKSEEELGEESENEDSEAQDSDGGCSDVSV